LPAVTEKRLQLRIERRPGGAETEHLEDLVAAIDRRIELGIGPAGLTTVPPAS